MGKSILRTLRENLESVGEKAPDTRKASPNLTYEIKDSIKSAFAVFFFQHPSLLSFQRNMEEKRKRSNLQTLLGVSEIPCDNRIRVLLDGIPPSCFSEVYENNLAFAYKEGVLDEFHVLDQGVLIALDGVWYHSSKSIHCTHCLHQEHQGITTYYQSTLAATIVKPGNGALIPVQPEMIQNEEGNEKQDCERNAAKRWIKNPAESSAYVHPTILGDAIFSCYPICKDILEAGMSFIFTCKPGTYKWITETVEHPLITSEVKRVREWNGRNHLVYTYRWLNGGEIRDDDTENLLVNYVSVEIQNQEKGKVTYYNSWITDKALTENNRALLVSCARAGWKLENEHNTVLKNHGYNLEDNGER